MRTILILASVVFTLGWWGLYNPKNLPDDPAKLLELMDRTDMQISISSAQKLISMNRKDIFWQALDSPKPNTRRRAAHMVRAFKDRAFLPKMRDLATNDTTEHVAIEALESYSALCRDDELGFVSTFTNDPRSLVSYTAQEILKRRSFPFSKP